MTVASFDAIAAGHPDPAGLSVLRGGQLSKHLLMVRMIADAVRVTPLPATLSPTRVTAVAAALDLLTETHRRDPAAVERVVGYPYVGAWLTHCVREMRLPDGRPPLAQLAGIVAAAATHAHLDFALDVPCPRGRVSLPTLGRWLAGTGADAVPVQRGRGRLSVAGVELPDDLTGERPGWSALRRLHGSGDRPMSVVFDDLDPYRSTPDMPATGRLVRGQFADWQDVFAAAWCLLCRDHPGWATQLPALLVALTPLRERGPAHGISATARRAFGAVALTRPGNAAELAAALCHELQHAKLNALLDLVQLCEPDDRRLYYAPWRADPRPLPALLHGTYAFLGVADFWQQRVSVDDVSGGRYELARRRSQVAAALETLQATDGLTAAGRRFVAGMATSLDGLSTALLPERDRWYAELANDDHHATWRLGNLRPDPAAVRALAAAWQAGRPVPAITEPDLVAEPERFMQSSRMRLLAAVAANRRPPAPDTRGAEVSAVHDGDAHLLQGRYARAAAHYRKALSGDGCDEAGVLAAWTGLAVTRLRTADPAEAAAWRSRPELVRALHRALAVDCRQPPGPEELARWLGTGGDHTGPSGGRWFDVAVQPPTAPG